MMRELAERTKCARALRAAIAFSLLMAGLSAGSPAAAGSFQVNPVHITMAADRKTASLTIKNTDPSEVAVRVIAYRWTQQEGEDVYSETADVIASPPIFTIAAGATQLVRLGLKPGSAGGAYRVIVEEIPRQQPSGSQVQVALRLNLPLYLLPPKGGAAQLSWSAWHDRNGNLVVAATNSGSLHAQVLEIGAADETGKNITLSKEMGVILPSSTRHWKIGSGPKFEVGAPILLKIRNSAGDTQEKILVEQR